MISSRLTETFQQTAGYDEFVAGPPPNVGTLPIKPSEEKVKPKSFSHGKTKSIVPQEFRPMPHVTPDARPRTAPGTRQAPSDLSDLSRFDYQNHTSRVQTPQPKKTFQDPPKTSDSSKGLNEKKRPKHFDLIQAAVSITTAKSPPESSQRPFDFYNESVAERNALPYKSSSIAVSRDIPITTLSNENEDTPPTQTLDSQRASFETMRASRNVMVLGSRATNHQNSTVLPRLFTLNANHNSAQLFQTSTKKDDLPDPHRNDDRRFVPPNTPHEARRKKRNGVRRTDLPMELETSQQENSNPVTSTRDIFSPLHETNLPPGRKRSKTAPTASTPLVLATRSQNKGPAVLTLKPFQDRANETNIDDNNSIPWDFVTLNKINKGHSSRDYQLVNETTSSSGKVPSQVSPDKSKRKRQKMKRTPRQTPKVPSNGASGELTSVHGAIQVKPTRKCVTDLAVDEHERKPNHRNDSDDSLEVEERETHQADPVQILRASIVSANGYMHKVGDNVILGKVLHPRPSRSMSGMEGTQLSLNHDDKTRSLSEAGNPASTFPSTPSSMPNTTSDSSLLPEPNTNAHISSKMRFSKLSPRLRAGTATLEVPPRDPPQAKTSLPNIDKRRVDHSPYQPSEIKEDDTMRIHATKSDTAEASRLTRETTSTKAHIADSQKTPSLSRLDTPRGRTPPLSEVLTQDFAQPPEKSRPVPSEAASKIQSQTQVREDNFPCEHSSVRQNQFQAENSELERSIALKKEAAAKALLKLKEVMTVPTWEHPSAIGRPRAFAKGPSHWRGLSIEDGGPIAPSAIFQKIMIPAPTPSVTRHSSSSSHVERNMEPELEQSMNGIAEHALPRSLQAALKEVAPRELANNDLVTSPGSLASAERPGLERRVRNGAPPVPQVKGTHSRMSSTVSATSATSAYSLPYHLVPTRGSSLRDSTSVSGDVGDSLKYHAEELGWH